MRVRLQSPAPAELDGSGGRLIEAIGVPFSTSTVDSELLSARSIREDLLNQSCSSQLSVPNSSVVSWRADMRRRVAEFRALGLRHVGEARQVQLMRDSHRSCWTCAVLGDNQVCFAAAGVVTFERIRPMQQDHQIAILLDTARFA